MTSTDMPAVLADETVQAAPAAERETFAWVETALTVMFTVAAVFLVSLLAVVTGLV